MFHANLFQTIFTIWSQPERGVIGMYLEIKERNEIIQLRTSTYFQKYVGKIRYFKSHFHKILVKIYFLKQFLRTVNVINVIYLTFFGRTEVNELDIS